MEPGETQEGTKVARNRSRTQIIAPSPSTIGSRSVSSAEPQSAASGAAVAETAMDVVISLVSATELGVRRLGTRVEALNRLLYHAPSSCDTQNRKMIEMFEVSNALLIVWPRAGLPALSLAPLQMHSAKSSIDRPLPA